MAKQQSLLEGAVPATVKGSWGAQLILHLLILLY